MKSLNKIFLFFLFAAASAILFASCEKETDNNISTGTPVIKYVRITSPASSDSLLVGAGQGQLIAIIGDNLQSTVEAWFNDQKATLTSTYVTRNSILVSVPSQIPIDITNKLKLVFANGTSLLHDFEVQISEPLVSSMFCEFVNQGDVATVRGDYFYEPLSVTFPGGVTGELVAVTATEIKVRVPAGATSGQLTVKTNFGETKSNFWFRDTRNIFIGSDPFEGWNTASLVVTNPGLGDPPKINGNYFRIKQVVGPWPYKELADGDAGSMPSYSKKIPDDAILNPDKYYLKFEINTMKPYNNNLITINAGGSVIQDTKGYKWAPPFDSKGLWQTVVLPYEVVVASYSAKPVVNPNGYWAMVLLHGPGELDADLSFDNFRVVPKEIK